MYRSLLVHIPTERSPRAAVDGSVSLALACGAHLDAIATGYEQASVPYVAGGGAAVAPVFEVDRDRALERAETALGIFEVAARSAEISYGSRAVSGTFGEVMTRVCASARLYDLTVVSQAEPDRETFDNQLPQELLLQTGAPLLFFPNHFRGPFRPGRIGICWDGSRLAGRALRDAMPLLGHADVLTAITLNEAEAPADASPAKFARHMARIGLPVMSVCLEAEHSKFTSSILSLVAEERLDLLVMGGYGHSRLQETVFGGVTREMFARMTVPVLMSH